MMFITDLLILPPGDRPPPSFLPCTSSLFSLGRGSKLYFSHSSVKPALTGLVVIFPDKGEFPPPGYTYVLKRGSARTPGDLNLGAPHALRAHLAVCRGDGPRVLEVGLCGPTQVPANWTGLDRTPLGYKANLNGRMTEGGVVICARFDVKEVHMLREDTRERVAEVNVVTVSVGTVAARRRSSLIGQILYGSAPAVPVKRPNGPALGKKSPTHQDASSAFFPPELEQSGVQATIDFANASILAMNHPSTRLQLARDRIANRFGDDGFGFSALAFDPEVAGMLINPDCLDRVVISLSNVVRGSCLDAVLALQELHELVVTDQAGPSVPRGDQMNAFDYIVAYGASNAVERGMDALMAPACRIVVDGCHTAKDGLHPVSMHHSLSVVCRANEMFSIVRDDFLSTRAQAFAAESFFIPTAAAAATNVTFSSQSTSPKNTTALAPPSSSPPNALSSYLSAGDQPQFHRLFPSENFEQTLSDRAFILLGAVNAVFNDVFNRAKNSNVKACPENNFKILNDSFERTSTMVTTGPFSAESSLELHVSLVCAFEGASPLTDVLFCLVWLCAYVSSEDRKTTFLQDFLIRASRLEYDAVGFLVRRIVFPLVMRRISAGLSPTNTANASSTTTMPNTPSHYGSGNTSPSSIPHSATPIVGSASFASPDSPNSLLLFDDASALLTILWRFYRKYLKAEMCVLFGNLVVPCFKLRTIHRLKIVQLISSWFDADRTGLVELFINFEHGSPLPHWKVFQEFTDGLCALATPHRTDSSTKRNSNRPQSIQKGLTPAQRFSSTGSGGSTAATPTSSILSKKSSRFYYDEEDDPLSVTVAQEASSALTTCLRHLVNLSGTYHVNSDASPGGNKNNRVAEECKAREASIRALHVAKTNGGPKAAVNYLVAAGRLEETPSAVAQFLRVHLPELGEIAVGDYLGDGGKTAEEQKFMVGIRDAYTRTAPRNVKDSLDEALRRFLTNGGFRLPGESQKIERLLEAFARRFVADHPNMGATEDAILILVFSVVMLNTDLHSPNIKKSNRMRKEQFIRNLSGVNSGQDFPADMLGTLYDSIAKNEIRAILKTSLSHSSQVVTADKSLPPPPAMPVAVFGASGTSGPSEDLTSIANGGAAAVPPLQGLASHTSLASHASLASAASHEDHLSEAAAEEATPGGGNGCEEVAGLLVQGLSVLSALYNQSFEYHLDMSSEAVTSIFEVMSPKVFQVVSSILQDESSRPEAVACALEMLEYCITVTLFLDDEASSKTERRVFASLLGKLLVQYGVTLSEDEDEILRDPSDVKSNQSPQMLRKPPRMTLIRSSSGGEFLDQLWFMALMTFVCRDQNDPEVGLHLARVHYTVSKLGDKISERRQGQTLKLLSVRLGFPELLSNNSQRVFLREGLLRHKNRDKQFFLFNDCLIRAHEAYASSSANKLRVEENLPLRTMRVWGGGGGGGISNVADDDPTGDANVRFEIVSPVSSFTVEASSKREMESWIGDITDAISKCMSEHSNIELITSPNALHQNAKSVRVGGSIGGGIAKTLPNNNDQPVLVPVKMTALPVAASVHVVIAVTSAPVAAVITSPHVTSTADFNQALGLAKQILVVDKIETSVKLLVYGYYKQCTKGDCAEEMPQGDAIKRAKWHAWRAHFGTPKDEAKRSFVRVVNNCEM